MSFIFSGGDFPGKPRGSPLLPGLNDELCLEAAAFQVGCLKDGELSQIWEKRRPEDMDPFHRIYGPSLDHASNCLEFIGVSQFR